MTQRIFSVTSETAHVFADSSPVRGLATGRMLGSIVMISLLAACSFDVSKLGASAPRRDAGPDGRAVVDLAVPYRAETRDGTTGRDLVGVEEAANSRDAPAVEDVGAAPADVPQALDQNDPAVGSRDADSETDQTPAMADAPPSEHADAAVAMDSQDSQETKDQGIDGSGPPAAIDGSSPWTMDGGAADGGGVCVGYASAPTSGINLTDGLIAYYPCEWQSASGMLPDLSGSGNTGTLISSAGEGSGYNFAAGAAGNALDLVAAKQSYVQLPSDLLAGACEASIATWVYLNSGGSWQRIFDLGKDQTSYMFLTPRNSMTGVLRFAITVHGSSNEQVVESPTALSLGTWHHVAVVLGADGATLYLDGASVGHNQAVTLRPADLAGATHDYIGRSAFAADPYLDGDIDEYRVYDRALSADEVKALANLL